MRAESMRSMRRDKLVEDLSEKDMRSDIARRKHEEEVMKKRYKDFVNNEDKKLNVERISRQQQYERDLLDKKIQDDNNRSIKIKQERQEIYQTKQKLRRDIDKDKQLILQDFEMIKQGKVEPDEVAKKYGYVARSPDGGSQKGSTGRNNHSQNGNNKTGNSFNNRTAGGKMNNSSTQFNNNQTKPVQSKNHGGSGIGGSNAEQRQEEQRRAMQERERRVDEMKRRHVRYTYEESRVTSDD